MKKSFLRAISLILIVCMTMCILPGCSNDDLTAEILQIWGEVFVMIEEGLDQMWQDATAEAKQALKEKIQDIKDSIAQAWHDATDENIQIWEETFTIFSDGVRRKYQSIRYPYEKLKKYKWETVFTSYIENERFEISRRHYRGVSTFGVHCTMYMIALYEDDVCTHYTVYDLISCPKAGWTECKSGMAMLSSSFGENNPIYISVRDLIAYQALLEMQDNTPADMLRQQALSGFSQVVTAQSDAILSETVSGAVGVILSGNELASQLYDVYDQFSEANDIQASTKEDPTQEQEKDLQEVIEDIDSPVPGVNQIVESTGVLVSGPAAISYYVFTDPGDNTQWSNLAALDTLSPDGRQLEFRKTDTHIQYKYTDDGEWTDLEQLSNLSSDEQNVVFLITDTHIQWRVLSALELQIATTQKALHETFKETAFLSP